MRSVIAIANRTSKREVAAFDASSDGDDVGTDAFSFDVPELCARLGNRRGHGRPVHVGLRMRAAVVSELASACMETVDDRRLRVLDEQFNEFRRCTLRDVLQSQDELGAAEVLRNDDVVSSSQVGVGQTQRQISGQKLRLLPVLPAPERHPDGIEFEEQGKGMVIHISLGQSRLADSRRAVQQDQTCDRTSCRMPTGTTFRDSGVSQKDSDPRRVYLPLTAGIVTPSDALCPVERIDAKRA